MFTTFFRGDFIVPNMDEAFPKKKEEKEDEKDSSVNFISCLLRLKWSKKDNVLLIYKSKVSLFNLGEETILGTSY